MTSFKQMRMKIISSLSRWQITVAVGKHNLSLCLHKIFCKAILTQRKLETERESALVRILMV